MSGSFQGKVGQSLKAMLRGLPEFTAATALQSCRSFFAPARRISEWLKMVEHEGIAPSTPVWKTGMFLSTPMLVQVITRWLRIALSPSDSRRDNSKCIDRASRDGEIGERTDRRRRFGGERCADVSRFANWFLV